ncbi:MAG: hypothetical protein HRU25_08025 [Psychrobium sp.]|nr:hypothetical protein [Psychrobium sp.]
MEFDAMYYLFWFGEKVFYSNLMAISLVVYAISKVSISERTVVLKVSSPMIGIICVVLSNLVSNLTGAKLRTMLGSNIDLVRHLWYLGFIVINLITVVLIVKWHEAFSLKQKKMTKTILLSFFVLSILQFVEYAIRIIGGVSRQEYENIPFIPELYSYGIASINLIVAVLVFFIAVKAASLKLKSLKRKSFSG